MFRSRKCVESPRGSDSHVRKEQVLIVWTKSFHLVFVGYVVNLTFVEQNVVFIFGEDLGSFKVSEVKHGVYAGTWRTHCCPIPLFPP